MISQVSTLALMILSPPPIGYFCYLPIRCHHVVTGACLSADSDDDGDDDDGMDDEMYAMYEQFEKDFIVNNDSNNQ